MPTADELASSVVQVAYWQPTRRTYCPASGNLLAGGSAVRIADDLIFITNFHVVDVPDGCDDDSVLTLLVQNGMQSRPMSAGTAEVVASDPVLDLAVLHATTFDGAAGDFADVRTAVIGNSGDLQLLANLTVVGFPAIGGNTRTTTAGQLNGFVNDTQVPGAQWMKTSATASHGNSGGGVFDAGGRLVGILSAVTVDDLAGIALARPIDEAAGLISRAVSTVHSQTTVPPPTTTTTGVSTTSSVPSTTSAPIQAAGQYVVVLGDTLLGTARAFNTTVEALSAINGLTTNVIFEHQVLLLPAGSRPLRPGDVVTVPYVVLTGDTIIGIAKRMSVTPAEIFTINNKLATQNTLAVGQTLLIPQFT